MKEAVLSVKHGDGSETCKVSVKLTSDNLILAYLEDSNHRSPIPSTTINSPLHSTNKESFSCQTTASLSSTDSSNRSVPITSKPDLLPPSQPPISLTQDDSGPSAMPASEASNPERVVTIKRQPGGGLGISVKGGAEHGIPVLVSRVFRGQAADQTHLLHPGDAIIAVNGKRVEEMMHDDVVAELRSCGPQVALTVRAYDGANHVLRTAASSATPSKSSVSSDQPLSPSDERRPSGNSPPPQPKLYEHPPPLPSKATPAQMHAEPATSSHNTPNLLNESTQLDSSTIRPWRSDVTIPLALAQLEHYEEGTDRTREDCFEVIACDGTRSGLITCTGKADLTDWVQAVSIAIHQANIKQAEDWREDSHGEHTNTPIYYMGWIGERPTTPNNVGPPWRSCFIAIRGDKLMIFDQPPQTSDDWSNCSRVHLLHESLCRSHVLPRQLLDGRQHCFSIQHSSKSPTYCSLQTRDDLIRLEGSIQKATHEAVYRLQYQIYNCTTLDDQHCEFVINFNHGFKMIDSSNQNVLWEYKFSQLKGSADDGKSRISFSFQNRTTNQIETQSFNCERAYPLLFCVHSFLAAKLSLVDPTFLEKINARARHNASDANPPLTNGGRSPRHDENQMDTAE